LTVFAGVLRVFEDLLRDLAAPAMRAGAAGADARFRLLLPASEARSRVSPAATATPRIALASIRQFSFLGINECALVWFPAATIDGKTANRTAEEPFRRGRVFTGKGGGIRTEVTPRRRKRFPHARTRRRKLMADDRMTHDDPYTRDVKVTRDTRIVREDASGPGTMIVIIVLAVIGLGLLYWAATAFWGPAPEPVAITAPAPAPAIEAPPPTTIAPTEEALPPPATEAVPLEAVPPAPAPEPAPAPAQ
jgi:hypothetical protein